MATKQTKQHQWETSDYQAEALKGIEPKSNPWELSAEQANALTGLQITSGSIDLGDLLDAMAKRRQCREWAAACRPPMPDLSAYGDNSAK